MKMDLSISKVLLLKIWKGKSFKNARLKCLTALFHHRKRHSLCFLTQGQPQVNFQLTKECKEPNKGMPHKLNSILVETLQVALLKLDSNNQMK